MTTAKTPKTTFMTDLFIIVKLVYSGSFKHLTVLCNVVKGLLLSFRQQNNLVRLGP